MTYITLPGPTGASRLHDWTDFYGAWHEAAGAYPHMTVTTFEDLKSRPVPTLQKNLQDLGISVAENVLTEAVERSSFANMRAHEEKHPDDEEKHPMIKTRIMRSGTPQEWHRWMTPTIAQRFG
ncbi:hypothetical protein GCM10018793_57880 [Streptomyces sulfonofaciens]|uniref:Sulfotransferase domain-containing protein n=1 Tax=Streptomyces sulfonofaciens TaxID=68272 RepID=A0A919L7J9_9ACTN|nr:sulfotransferase domain-containing protein [Streptomyces sulfonofaciens]GHH86349.1 hypothetical protein GCM10018793_57880 [Streptomyces sulfonofaciens]